MIFSGFCWKVIHSYPQGTALSKVHCALCSAVYLLLCIQLGLLKDCSEFIDLPETRSTFQARLHQCCIPTCTMLSSPPPKTQINHLSSLELLNLVSTFLVPLCSSQQYDCILRQSAGVTVGQAAFLDNTDRWHFVLCRDPSSVTSLCSPEILPDLLNCSSTVSCF